MLRARQSVLSFAAAIALAVVQAAKDIADTSAAFRRDTLVVSPESPCLVRCASGRNRYIQPTGKTNFEAFKNTTP